MNHAVLIDSNGKKTRELELESPVLNTPLKESLIHSVVVAKLSVLHRGTASAKTRGEVRGSGKKPWRQKGTGRARAGSVRNPVWTGGGVAFAPKPRSFKKNVNVKAKRRALCSLLSNRADTNSLFVVENFPGFEKPSTRSASEWLGKIGMLGDKVLLVDSAVDKTRKLSFRNLKSVTYVCFDNLSILDVIKNEKIVFTSESLKSFVEKMERCL